VEHALTGTRVLEVASWTFVPAAGAVLADWGADVIKIEHPVTGDPQRGLVTTGLLPGGPGAVNFMMEIPNRGKRSVALDLASPDGRELLYALAETSDVFLTNFLPDTRRRLLIDVEHIRERNPDIVYVRGSGQGTRGPDSTKGGFDGASYNARGGVMDALTPEGLEWPVGGGPAFGDLQGAMNLVAGITAALLRRERTGQTAVVDVSLLATAMWVIAPSIVASEMFGLTDMPMPTHEDFPNPIVNAYKTSDDRVIQLIMLESDKYWPDLCEHLGRPELADDPRFHDAALRNENRRECIATLDEVFASRPLEEWKQALRDARGVWAPVQRASELADDPQVVANGYLRPVSAPDGSTFHVVGPPIEFDGSPTTPVRAPEHGEHTDEVLLELGLSWDDIINHKISGAVL
jgi:crotonobetainyl-CoA:carnitine CoA-transferase CaiB-like acyl-CoA transferase